MAARERALTHLAEKDGVDLSTAREKYGQKLVMYGSTQTHSLGLKVGCKILFAYIWAAPNKVASRFGGGTITGTVLIAGGHPARSHVESYPREPGRRVWSAWRERPRGNRKRYGGRPDPILRR